ncbi:peptidyl-prolyl cis-trans isomerase [Reichenbachiella agariperforans]|uniref:peptidylprolyl isomerase n=1 Tax=Reichenbachiella agariperforans TaxID=156994 RepID=UPI001C093301|nr:peptidylprolyl isomerase [Reichenbachiella agariperforans]MBU2914730.1 peptidyl-prolyl cis-trans isomerase [Reichenbachiella agariperforans]
MFSVKNIFLYFVLLCLGAAVMYFFIHQEVTDDKTIVVDKESLYYHSLFRYGTKHDSFNDSLGHLDGEHLDDLVADYVRDEVMFREANHRELGEKDSVIRAWLIEKMELLVHGMMLERVVMTEDEKRAHFEENKEDYFILPNYTFAHVFFDSKKHGAKHAMELAHLEREDLNQNDIGFDDASGRGDLFKYHTFYTKRNSQYVANHFGEDFVNEIDKAPISHTHWTGPYASNKGYHLIMLTARSEGRYPNYEEVADQVTQDLQTIKVARVNQIEIERLMDSYTVVIRRDDQV